MKYRYPRFTAVALLLFFAPSAAFALEGVPEKWKRISIGEVKRYVVDGDTLDADLNGNGKINKKKERIRLLYVDTPELSTSHKGKDVKFGKPARKYLEKALKKPKAALWIDPKNRTDNHGRILAILEVAKKNFNLDLIRKGHALFDSRFSFPQSYDRYAKAEATAFRDNRGIWSEKKSRNKYLKRLKSEGRTVYSAKNPVYISTVLGSRNLKLTKYRGKFLKVRGKIRKSRNLSKGVRLIFLESAARKKGLAVVSFQKGREKSGLKSTAKGKNLYVEGFVQKYKKDWQIQSHRGWIEK